MVSRRVGPTAPFFFTKLRHCILFATIVGSARAGPAWLAFKYDASHVLFYVCDGQVPADMPQPIGEYPDPAASWGRGGILAAPTESVLSQPACRELLAGLPTGEHVKVTSDGKHLEQGVVERYVEQWGSSAPKVRIGVIARTVADHHRASAGEYFVVFQGAKPEVEASGKTVQIQASPKVLSDLSNLGNIVLFSGDAGWLVAVCKRQKNGTLAVTNLQYSYGD